MWKIAVADTAEDHLTLLKDALKAYFQETHRVFSVTSYTDLTFLEKDMAQGEHFDLLILDLVMNGQRSVEAVRRIREKEDGTPLIFLTANRERTGLHDKTFEKGAPGEAVRPAFQKKKSQIFSPYTGRLQLLRL